MPNVQLNIVDQSFATTATAPQKVFPIAIATATSLAAAQVWRYTPGYRFRVLAVSSFARTVTATISFNVRIGTQTVMASGTNTPVADTLTAHSLSATATDYAGSDTESLNVTVTTDGTGAATNLVVNVTIRPLGLSDESDAV